MPDSPGYLRRTFGEVVEGCRTVMCDGDVVVVTFDAELWIWESRRVDTWVFVSLPTDVSERIRELADGPRRGFGSVRVRAMVGNSRWTTSIFPDSGRATVTVELIDF
jgi:hypothetical protein